MGQVDESLQVFLHCLSVDEDFPCAKRQVEKVRAFKRKSAGSVEKWKRQNIGVILKSHVTHLVVIPTSGSQLSWGHAVFMVFIKI